MAIHLSKVILMPNISVPKSELFLYGLKLNYCLIRCINVYRSKPKLLLSILFSYITSL